MERSKKTLGISLTFVAAFFLAIMGYFTVLLQNSMPSSLIIAYRFLFGLMMLAPFMFIKKGFNFKANKINLIFVRSLSGFLAMLLFFYALKRLPLANSILLLNTSPLFTPVIVYCLAKVKTNRYVIVSIIFSFIGFLIIVHPESTSYSIWGYIIGIFSGFFAALATTLLRLVGKENKPEQMMFYYFLFTSILGLMLGASHIKELTEYQFMIILLLAFISLMYQFGLTYALKLIEVRIVTSVMLFINSIL